MLYIFIDTNIVMHFKPVQEIDWLGLAKAKECTVVVAPVVVDELDAKKYGHTKKAQRAQAFLKVVRDCLTNSEYKLKENVRILILPKKPSRSFMESQDLIFEENDQKLLATLMEFRNSANTEEILFCTSDIGAHARAHRKDIQVLNLPEEYKFAPELSEEEKEIRELKLENEKLKNRVPKLSLMAEGQQTFVSLQRKDSLNFTIDEYVSNRRAELINLHPPFRANAFHNSEHSLSLFPPKDQMLAYNTKLETFYKNHIDIFRHEYSIMRHESLFYKLSLILRVDGSVPAERVEVELFFPEGVSVHASFRPILKPLSLPSLPSLPQWGVAPLLERNELSPLNSRFDVSRYLLEQARPRQQIKIDVPSDGPIKHNSFRNLPELLIVFSSERKFEGFKFNYSLSADNLPTPISGEMNVKFNNPENQIAGRVATE